MTLSTRLSCLTLLTLAVNTGCVHSVAWLSDSSGFVYVAGNQDEAQLIHYDLTKNSKSLVAANLQTTTTLPALNLDDRRIAVGRLFFMGNRHNLLMQITVYDFQGMKLHTSKTLEWRVGREPTENFETQLFWSSQGNKLIVAGDNTTGIYDLHTERLVKFEGVIPMVFGTTPIRPDGKGFLVTRMPTSRQSPMEIAFVDWEGRKEAINLKPGTPVSLALVWPFLGSSRWEGDVAMVDIANASVRVDTRARTCSHREIKDDPGFQQQYLFSDGGRIKVTTPESTGGPPPSCRIEFLGARAKEPLTLVAQSAPECLLIPSPDGKLVAICYRLSARGGENNPGPGKITVVNTVGKIVADLGL